jgi:hypothetical protein
MEASQSLVGTGLTRDERTILVHALLLHGEDAAFVAAERARCQKFNFFGLVVPLLLFELI